MALYAIADVHLSLGADKPMDVFPGWEDYTRRLQENWHRLVKPDDTVVIAGDISWAMRLEDTREDFAYLHALPGKKLLLKGNHDYWWTTRRKMERYLETEGFTDITFVHNSAVPVQECAVCGTRGWLAGAMSEEDQKIVNREVGRLKTSLDEALRQIFAWSFCITRPFMTGPAASPFWIYCGSTKSPIAITAIFTGGRRLGALPWANMKESACICFPAIMCGLCPSGFFNRAKIF